MLASYVKSGARVIDNCEPTYVSVGTELLDHLLETTHHAANLCSFLSLFSKSDIHRKVPKPQVKQNECYGEAAVLTPQKRFPPLLVTVAGGGATVLFSTTKDDLCSSSF